MTFCARLGSIFMYALLYLFAATAMGGDVTVASAASQQSKNSQSQSSADSSQVDGTQPVLNANMTFLTDQLYILCDRDEQLLLHEHFQTVKSKQLLQEECCQSSLSESESNPLSKKNIKLISSTDATTEIADSATRTIPQLDGANQESSKEEESEDSEEEDEIVNQVCMLK